MARKATWVDAQKRPFAKKLLGLSGRYSVWEVWSDFITIFACALSNSFDRAHFEKREKEYLRIIGKYEPKEQGVFPDLVAEVTLALEQNPEQDFLGTAFMELELGNDHAGQFFTPYSTCRAMATLSGSGIASRVLEKGYAMLNDPACGAGATLIAACHEAGKQLALFGRDWRNHILVTGQDIDYIVGMMCYIQLSLIGAAGYIKIGDSLAEPMCSGDKLDNYWFTPMYFSDVWHNRRKWHYVDKILRGA